MKTYICCLLLVLHGIDALAQKNKKEDQTSLYVFNEKWEPCKIEEAKYLGCFDVLSDTTYRWRYYNFTGPLINVETYKDKEGKTPHGYFAFFGNNGLIDSSGYTFNGRKDKSWHYYTDSLTVWQSEEYNKGILLSRMDEAMLKEERRMAEATGFLPGDKEAVLKGGDREWIKYLQNNLQFPDRAMHLDKQGKVMINFMVDTDGIPGDISIAQSVEYSLDEEAMRLIQKSPKWEPAIQKGKPVRAYRRQPITFALQ